MFTKGLSFRRVQRMMVSKPLIHRVVSIPFSSLSQNTKDKLELTDSCVQRLHQLSKGQSNPLMLRLAISSGGCSGFQYEFTFEDHPAEEDLQFSRDGATVLVDPVSFDFVKGSTIDYVEELVRSSFVVGTNPNAEAGCGCGHSFSSPL